MTRIGTDSVRRKETIAHEDEKVVYLALPLLYFLLIIFLACGEQIRPAFWRVAHLSVSETD